LISAIGFVDHGVSGSSAPLDAKVKGELLGVGIREYALALAAFAHVIAGGNSGKIVHW
jgi:hypothetical protein